MNLSKFLLISFLFFGASSCKKDDPKPADNTTSSPNANPNIYYGVLSSFQVSLLNTGSTTLTPNGGITTALFSSVPMSGNGIISGTSLNAGTVSISGVTLKKNNFSGLINYNDSTNTYFPLDHNWVVTGSGAIPAINFSMGSAFPAFTGYNSLQDTIHKGQNTNINLNGIAGADEVSVYISDLTNSTTVKNLETATTTVSFTPTELSALNSTGNGMIVIVLRKNNYQLFGNKTFKFQSGFQFQKTNVIIKP